MQSAILSQICYLFLERERIPIIGFSYKQYPLRTWHPHLAIMLKLNDLLAYCKIVIEVYFICPVLCLFKIIIYLVRTRVQIFLCNRLQFDTCNLLKCKSFVPPRETLYNRIACIASLTDTSLPKSRCERDIAFAICHASVLLETTGGIFDLIAGRKALGDANFCSVNICQLTFGILQVIAAQ